MLTQLEIKNYAIIQHVLIDFDKGLNIITGETGAGKSILLGALGLALGERADTKALYQQEEKCVIEASFNINNYNLQALFEKFDLDYATTTIVRREISPSGKSRAFVNDTPVNLDVLKTLAEKLVNLTSQNETQQLNKESYQLDILDATANNEVILTEYKKAYFYFLRTKKELSQLESENAQLQKDYDFFSFQLNEIIEAQLEDENIEALEEELSSLSNAEAIKIKLYNLAKIIENEEGSVLPLLNEGAHQVKEIAKFKKEYQDILERLNSSIIELEDIKTEAENIADKTDFDEERIEIITQKVNEGNRLLRKHQVASIEDLMAVKEDLDVKTSSVQNNSKQIEKLQKELSSAEKNLSKVAKSLSDSRKKALELVQADIQNTMQKVGMPNAVFEVSVADKNAFTENGKDNVSFKFNANKGFAPQALNKIASGGELSRVMLSIQALLAKKAALPTLIFDEIDTGISGETAAKVAEVFREISEGHQLIAITHLPQIAAKAEKHFFIYKTENEEKTNTKIAALNDENHIKAIARMLSGERISEESLNNAKSLINT